MENQQQLLQEKVEASSRQQSEYQEQELADIQLEKTIIIVIV
ncbi:hypothetical protein [Okeania sp. SIO2C9]|nr:hypothetical protein [Okeania sp. SIO2C9]